VLKEKAGSRIGYNTILELLYKHIVSLTAETCHRLTFVDNDNRTYSLISNAGISAYTIEAEIKSKIAPLDYPQHG
jgi:hypothetical protein